MLDDGVSPKRGQGARRQRQTGDLAGQTRLPHRTEWAKDIYRRCRFIYLLSGKGVWETFPHVSFPLRLGLSHLLLRPSSKEREGAGAGWHTCFSRPFFPRNPRVPSISKRAQKCQRAEHERISCPAEPRFSSVAPSFARNRRHAFA